MIEDLNWLSTVGFLLALYFGWSGAYDRGYYKGYESALDDTMAEVKKRWGTDA